MTIWVKDRGLLVAESVFPRRRVAPCHRGPGAAPAANVFNLEINLVQSGAQKRPCDKIFRCTYIFFSLNECEFPSLKSAKSLRNDTPGSICSWSDYSLWPTTLGDVLANRLSSSGAVVFLFVGIFVHLVVPMQISPMGNLGRFPQEKPAATVALPNPNLL